MQKYNLSLGLLSCFFIVGCQTTPAPVQSTVKQPQAVIVTSPSPETTKVITTPYPDSGIRRESQPLPSTTPPRVILPEQQPTPQRNLKDGRGVAAYEKLMQDYLQSLNKGDLANAESQLLQAQRIAPQSADVYRELARLANLRKQAANAEALARKGLTFAQNNVQRKQLWQQILQAAQLRNNAALIQQAQRNIAKY